MRFIFLLLFPPIISSRRTFDEDFDETLENRQESTPFDRQFQKPIDHSGEEEAINRLHRKWNRRAHNYFGGVRRKERQQHGDSEESKEERLQNYQLPSGYGGGGSSYGLPPKPYKPEKPERARVSKDAGSGHRQHVAGLPDTSDPCFRRYANAIIVNAQPYERRSSSSLSKCKRHCLESQRGLYTCRSFVYDNVNQVCDLFAHVGDQAPAKLLKYQTRDYFEPTGAVQCDVSDTTSASTNENTSTAEAEIPSIDHEDDLATEASIDSLTDIDGFRDERQTNPTTYGPSTSAYGSSSTSYGSSSSYGPIASSTSENDISINSEPSESAHTFFEDEDFTTTDLAPISSQTPESSPIQRSITRDSCPKGKATRFLRTADFELYKNDDVTIAVSSVDECVDACTNNEVNSQALDCKSFDFTEGHCSLTVEAAVPLGTGQLKQNHKSQYYEKICIDEQLIDGCPKVFARFPQMILVGFAESVTDAPSFQDCFHSCLNSFALYGFNCSSGMYYFEENQLNCILNTEDRHTQADLFAEENTDIVDYFEVGCERKTRNRARAFGMKTLRNDDPPKIEKLVTAEQTATEWSKCEDGVQHRRRDCADRALPCGLESRPCSSTKEPIESLGELEPFTVMDRGGYARTTDSPLSSRVQKMSRKKDSMSMDKLKSAIKRLTCPVDVCCKVFDSCQIGLMRDSRKRKVEWCRRPCS